MSLSPANESTRDPAGKNSASPCFLAIFALLAIAAFHAPAITWEYKTGLGELVSQTIAQAYLGTCIAALLIATVWIGKQAKRGKDSTFSTRVSVLAAWGGTLMCAVFVLGSLGGIASMYIVNNGNVADWWYVDALDHIGIFLVACCFWSVALLILWTKIGPNIK